MKELNPLRRQLTKAGWDVIRYREFLPLLVRYGIDLVIDVGANEGQFVEEVRFWGYKGQIWSYEPCLEPFEKLSKLARGASSLTCVNKALGHEAGTITMRVYADTRFSSVLRLQRHRHGLHGARRSGRDPRRGIRKNRAWLDKFTRRFLKIDTQGFEKSVLLGAEQSLGEIAGVMMECSLTPIYDGQWPLEEAFAHMRARGFTPGRSGGALPRIIANTRWTWFSSARTSSEASASRIANPPCRRLSDEGKDGIDVNSKRQEHPRRSVFEQRSATKRRQLVAHAVLSRYLKYSARFQTRVLWSHGLARVVKCMIPGRRRASFMARYSEGSAARNHRPNMSACMFQRISMGWISFCSVTLSAS